jgi:superoxide dismutase, Fe-Mn family
MNRRTLLKSAGMATGVMVASTANMPLFALSAKMQIPPTPVSAAPFTLPLLPYSYDALEPFADAETMHLHHDKHHASYVEKLNAAVASDPSLAHRDLPDMLNSPDSIPEPLRASIRNQGGGHANHSFWWPILAKNGARKPKGELAKDIDQRFGSFSRFQEQMTKAAIGVFGSGWAWLNLDSQGNLLVETTANQDSPITLHRTPILRVDIWEHAYYLKYQNRRPEYLQAFFQVVNWEYVSSEYAKAKSCCKVQM